MEATWGYCIDKIMRPLLLDQLLLILQPKAFLEILLLFETTSSPGDSKWPFYPLVGGHLTFERGHLTIPKRAQRIARQSCFFFRKRPGAEGHQLQNHSGTICGFGWSFGWWQEYSDVSPSAFLWPTGGSGVVIRGHVGQGEIWNEKGIRVTQFWQILGYPSSLNLWKLNKALRYSSSLTFLTWFLLGFVWEFWNEKWIDTVWDVSRYDIRIRVKVIGDVLFLPLIMEVENGVLEDV